MNDRQMTTEDRANFCGFLGEEHEGRFQLHSEVLFLCFRNFHTTHFLHAGLVCLSLGTATAVPAGLLAAAVLRRGFAVDAGSAGLAGGTLAGLAGVSMLELHCPNFETAHLLVWHVGVLLVSAALGKLIARYARRRSTDG